MFVIKHKKAMRFLDINFQWAAWTTEKKIFLIYKTAHETFNYITSRNIVDAMPQNILKKKGEVQPIFYAFIDRNEDTITCINLNSGSLEHEYLQIDEVVENFV